MARASGTGYTKDISYTPDADFNGTDRFEVQVSDGWLTDDIVIYVCIAPQDDPPIIAEGSSIAVTMDEDGYPTDFSLTLNASDPDGDLLTWSVISPAANGTANVSGEGDSQPVSYTPAPGYIGTDSFVVQVSDGGLSDSITVNVEINATAEGDCDILCEQEGKDCVAVYMDEDSFPSAFDLTLRASDSDGDILTWSISSPASNGTAHVSGTGYTKEISYIPNADYNGTDRFEIQVSDGWLTDSVVIYVCISPRDDVFTADAEESFDNEPEESFDKSAEIPMSADTALLIPEEDTGAMDTVSGDIDDNEAFDVSDAVLVLQILAGITPVQSEFTTADVNGDGRIGTEEVIHILQTISDLR